MSKVTGIHDKRNNRVARQALQALKRFRKTDDEPVKVSMRRLVEDVVPDASPWVVKKIADDLFTEMDELAGRITDRMKDGRQD